MGTFYGGFSICFFILSLNKIVGEWRKKKFIPPQKQNCFFLSISVCFDIGATSALVKRFIVIYKLNNKMLINTSILPLLGHHAFKGVNKMIKSKQPCVFSLHNYVRISILIHLNQGPSKHQEIGFMPVTKVSRCNERT